MGMGHQGWQMSKSRRGCEELRKLASTAKPICTILDIDSSRSGTRSITPKWLIAIIIGSLEGNVHWRPEASRDEPGKHCGKGSEKVYNFASRRFASAWHLITR